MQSSHIDSPFPGPMSVARIIARLSVWIYRMKLYRESRSAVWKPRHVKEPLTKQSCVLNVSSSRHTGCEIVSDIIETSSSTGFQKCGCTFYNVVVLNPSENVGIIRIGRAFFRVSSRKYLKVYGFLLCIYNPLVPSLCSHRDIGAEDHTYFTECIFNRVIELCM